MSLTPKQARFVEEYLVDLNATQAAIRAGYSAKTANPQAARLLADVSVKTAISEARGKRSERTTIDADWVLRRLAEEAEADLADLYTEEGGLKPVHQWPKIWRKGLVAGVDVETLKEDGGVIGHVRKLKLSDRTKRLELIGKHVGVQAFRDQLDVKVQAFDGMSDDELGQLVAAARKTLGSAGSGGSGD